MAIEISEPMTPEQMMMRIKGLELELTETKTELEDANEANKELEGELRVVKDRTSLMLNVSNPFERVINEMVQLQRVKSQDYAGEDDILKNMRFVVDMLGIPDYTVVEDCNAMVLRKCARIINLRGRPAKNESVRDSYIDRAVYAVLSIVALNGVGCDYDYDDYDYCEKCGGPCKDES